MTLEKAITLLADTVYHHSLRKGAPPIEAVRLGIEALKRLKDARVSGYFGLDEPLPGETKE